MTSRRKPEKKLKLRRCSQLPLQWVFHPADELKLHCLGLQLALFFSSASASFTYSASCRFWLVTLLTVALQSGLRTRRCSPKYRTWNMYDCRTRFSLEKQLNEDNYKTKSLRNGGGVPKWATRCVRVDANISWQPAPVKLFYGKSS